MFIEFKRAKTKPTLLVLLLLLLLLLLLVLGSCDCTPSTILNF
jgi:hypothetical protein